MTSPQVPVSGSVGGGGGFPTLGSTPVVLAGAPYTLRLFAPTSEVCYQQILVTGTSSGSSIVAPLVAGFTFCVVNNSDGPFEFGGSSGDTVTIPVSVGASGTWVTTDGTNYGPASGSGGSSGAGYVIFRPGVVSSGQAVATQAEVQAAVNAGALDVYIDSANAAAVFPAGFRLTPAPGPGKGTIRLLSWNAISQGNTGADVLTVDDTATIDSVSRVSGLTLRLANATTGALTFSQITGSQWQLFIDSNAIVESVAGAMVPAFEVSGASDVLFVFVKENSYVQGLVLGGQPLFKATGGTLFPFVFENSIGTSTAFGSSGSGTFIYGYDASAPPQSWTVNTGTYFSFAFDSDQNLAYGAGAAFPASPIAGQPWLLTTGAGAPAHYTWSGSAWVLTPRLSRTVFIDGGGLASVANGSQASPYTTITAGLTPFGGGTQPPASGNPTSEQDANSIVQAWIASTINGYTAEPGDVINIPAYRQVWLQGIPADSSLFFEAAVVGPSTNATITWANTTANGGANPPEEVSTLALVSMQVQAVTITDNGTSPEFLLLDAASVAEDVTGTGASVLAGITMINNATVEGDINAPTAGVEIASGSSAGGSVTCAFLEVNDGLVEGSGTVTVSTSLTLNEGSVLSIGTSDYTADTMTAEGATVIGDGTITTSVTANNTSFSGTLKCDDALITNCTFGAGFQFTVTTTLTIDAESWVNYLANGGSPGLIGTLSIIGQAAYGYTTANDFPQGLTVTPATSPGTPVLAFNATPTQTGVIDMTADMVVDTGLGDVPAFAVFYAPGTATGALAAGHSALYGDDANPLTVPGSPVLIALFQNLPSSTPVVGVTTTTITAHIDGLTLGTAYSFWVQAVSQTGTVAWTLSLNARAQEKLVN